MHDSTIGCTCARVDDKGTRCMQYDMAIAFTRTRSYLTSQARSWQLNKMNRTARHLLYPVSSHHLCIDTYNLTMHSGVDHWNNFDHQQVYTAFTRLPTDFLLGRRAHMIGEDRVRMDPIDLQTRITLLQKPNMSPFDLFFRVWNTYIHTYVRTEITTRQLYQASWSPRCSRLLIYYLLPKRRQTSDILYWNSFKDVIHIFSRSN